MLGLGLGLTSVLMGGGSAWSPTSLFKDGEQGWLMDLSLASLFQDARGGIPVTAPGQPVGFVLDKSKGGLGPQIGNMSLKPEDFVIEGGALVVTDLGDRLRFTRTSAPAGARQAQFYSVPVVAGRYYDAAFSILATSPSVTSYTSVNNGGATDLMSSSYHIGRADRRAIHVATGAGTGTLILRVAVARGSDPSSSVEGDWIEIAKTFSLRELPGNHWTQPTALNRPIYRVDAEGNPYLSFNGTNQWMQTAAFDWGSDAVTQVVGIDRKSDKASIAFEFSPATGTNPGSFYLSAPDNPGGRFGAAARGTNVLVAALRADTALAGLPDVSVISAQHSISGSRSDIWKNGVAGTPATGDKGSGNFGNYPLFIGIRGGSTLQLTGNMYPSLGINRLLSGSELTSAEEWAAKRTGGLTP